jgi:predicted transcriptional regulator
MMSYHHSQRVIAHLNPIRESANNKSKPGNRHDKLSGSAQAVLHHIASALNVKTGSFPVSIERLYQRTSISKQTIQVSLERLVEFGVLDRERKNYRQAFTYSLMLQCPEECKNLKEHNTPRELAERPSYQDAKALEISEPISESPSYQEAVSPSYQEASVLDNSSLIKIDKKNNKEYVGQHCFSCKGSIETIAGTSQVIHLEGCKQLAKLMSSQPWLIAGNKLGARWQELSSREQQLHYQADLAEYKNNSAEKDRQAKRVEDHATEKALALIPEGILPNWKTWLIVTYKRLNEIPGQHLTIAERKSFLGNDLIKGRPWEQGAFPQSTQDWGEYESVF